jgi:hypothetical protein
MYTNQKWEKYTKMATKITNGNKYTKINTEFSRNNKTFPSQGLPEYTIIGLLGIKINHLATLFLSLCNLSQSDTAEGVSC